ncbi:NAD(P) transhydrogenase subunit alpha [Blastopirellula sp. JC732]|uniref:proton-translocating NAD(P)(+) transhydrogenase n=1 Tax=Blastopirellula sediminis TaxID=2894196 RepID=A0A9X1MJK2_9BACT|nr:NAD(P) transhydrogenase subunit alpha [Blastopirellula sediminis]MCC9609709.1 NAD(P) transhydrogenase subunit alpha [Blastopirellula sediminis]MCC9627515.1 NAD(P) transhydrogenase subunit alpha [Blastopirellula sediminis]
MIIAVVRENFPGEKRVALIPASLVPLRKIDAEIVVETGAGVAAGFPDADYEAAGAKIVPSRADAFAQADVVLQVRSLGSNPVAGRVDLDLVKPGQILIGGCDPLGNPAAIQEMAAKGATQFALELIPRITRAQSMDILSSQATITGYRAVLIAATELHKIFPLMMTAAGTLSPAKVFVIGAGVAGLQAIATAKRLGAVVLGYDVRKEAQEQIESLGAKAVDFQLESGGAQDKGGYAKDLGEEFYKKQREFMANTVRECDVVITTAAIPGKKSPLLVNTAAVNGMRPGSIVVDLAAERGGNVEPSEADVRVDHNGVLILGPTNLPAEVPQHASQMFSGNITKFLLNLVKKGEKELTIDPEKDEIVAGTLVARGGDVVSNRIREMLGMPPIVPPEPNDKIPLEDEPTPPAEGNAS